MRTEAGEFAAYLSAHHNIDVNDKLHLFYTQNDQNRRTVESYIFKNAAAVFGVAITDLKGKSRKRNIVDARAVVAFNLRKRGYTLSTIGAMLGNRDHTTAINSLEKYDELIQYNTDFKYNVNEFNRLMEMDYEHIRQDGL